VDGDVASDVVNSYMTWIACILKEIELMTFNEVHLYRLYRWLARAKDAPGVRAHTHILLIV